MTRPASPFAPPPLRRKPTVKRDTMADLSEKAAVHMRDKMCVADRATTPNWTPDKTWNFTGTCQGRLEVDHVRASGALSKKSVTHRSNMVLLCSWHHKLKTEYGRTWRPLLLAYLERLEVGE